MNIIAASVKDESAESLARKMLAEATGEKPENIVFYRGENGKPLTRLPLFFNCSHSGDHVVCAVSKKEIGVDLERIRPVHERMERAEAERRWLAALPQARRAEAFLRLWTLKESWIKCRGGRLMEFRQAEFVLQGDKLLSAPAGYVLTVCEKN